MAALDSNQKAVVEHRVDNSNLKPISLDSQQAAPGALFSVISPITVELSPQSSVLSPIPVVLSPKPDWRIWLPAVLLIAVALVQISLVKTAGLGPWKGGGFGMFATTDGTATRHVRIFVEAPERSEELDIAPSQEFAASRAELFPSDSMMGGLARAVLVREQRYGRPVQSVRLEVWRTEFSPGSLEATDRPLRVFTLYADQTAHDPR